MQRCPWVDLSKVDYIAYHDDEWGVPVHDDRSLFELLVLESAQAGLSWYTVLNKRYNYRKAFDDFDPMIVAEYNDNNVEQLVSNVGIIRNRSKILAAINNARCFLKIQNEFGSFDSYLWQFIEGRPVVNKLAKMSDYPANSQLSDIISKDMKQRGFRFFGTTICYAFLQAVGIVNDHSLYCFRRQPIIDSYSVAVQSSVTK